MEKLSRRNIITVLSVAGFGVIGVRYNSEPTLAADGWSVNNPAVVEDGNGFVSSLKIEESGFSVGSFKLSNFESGDHEITFTIRAKLSGDTSYEDVSTGTFTVQEGTEINTISWNQNPFRANILSETSIDAGEFKSTTSGRLKQ
jgi:hypothetical protein